MAEETRELLVRVSATTELLRSQLTAAERAVDGFEKKVSASNDNIGKAFQRGAVSAGQMRFAMRDLAAQVGDIGTQFSLGARPMQIFAAQGSQVAGAIGLMAGEATALGRFLGGPWFQILSVAAIVLAPFVAKLFEGEEAMKAVTAASNGVSDAQNALGGIFDLTTGKIKSQNEMLLLNARIMAINLRADAAAKGASAAGALTNAGDGRASLLDQIVATATFRPMSQDVSTSRRAKALATTVANLKAGRTKATTAAQWAEHFNFSGLRVNKGEFIQALADQSTAEGKRKIADLIDKSLDSGVLANSLRKPASTGTRRTRQAAEKIDPFFRKLDEIEGDNSAGFGKLAEERTRLMNKAAEDSWKEQRKGIEQQAQFEYDQRAAVEEKLRGIRETQLQTLSGLYQNLFSGGTKAIWDDFARIGERVIAQVLARFTLAKATGGGFDLGSALSLSLTSVLGFADGGRPPMGRVSVVGERGPELFVPDVAGTVIPNHALGGGGVSLTINAPGATAETVAMIRRELVNAAPMLTAAAVGQTTRIMNRRTL